MCLPHTQHTVSLVATGNKHPLSTEIHPLTEQYTVMAFLPDSPSPLEEMKQEGAAPPSKAPRGHNSLYKFESVHFMQTWTNPPKNKQATTASKVTQNYIVYLITQLCQVSTPIPLICFPNDRNKREGIKTQVSWEAFLTTLTHMIARVVRRWGKILLSISVFLEGNNKYGICRGRRSCGCLSLPLLGKQDDRAPDTFYHQGPSQPACKGPVHWRSMCTGTPGMGWAFTATWVSLALIAYHLPPLPLSIATLASRNGIFPGPHWAFQGPQLLCKILVGKAIAVTQRPASWPSLSTTVHCNSLETWASSALSHTHPSLSLNFSICQEGDAPLCSSTKTH